MICQRAAPSRELRFNGRRVRWIEPSANAAITRIEPITSFSKMLCIFILIGTMNMTGCGPSIDIWDAIDRENESQIEAFAREGGSLDFRESTRSSTPLLFAIHHGRKRSYFKMLELGANPNAFSSDGWSAIYEASRSEDVFWLTEALRHGGDPNLANANATSQRSVTPLECAIADGRLSNVKLLLGCGANIDYVDPVDGPPLCVAARRVQYEVAYYLLENNANWQSPTLNKSMFLRVVQAHLRARPIPDLIQRQWFQKTLRWVAERGIDPGKIEFHFAE